MNHSLTNMACVLALSAILLGCNSGSDDDEEGKTAGGDKSSLTSNIGMKLVKIPAGEFTMGHESLTFGSPLHEVKIDKLFYLGVHEVTQEQYEAVMGSNPSHFSPDRGGTLQHPVDNVSWMDAVEFCNRLSEKEGLSPYYKIEADEVTTAGGAGYRLPTEAEWEYACRAGTTTRWWFGDGKEDYMKHFGKTSITATSPVGKLDPNPNGLYDMHGNVWEWCYDWAKPYAGQAPTVEPAGGKRRILRGGSFDAHIHLAESGFRGSENPTHRSPEAGFRVAKDAE